MNPYIEKFIMHLSGPYWSLTVVRTHGFILYIHSKEDRWAPSNQMQHVKMTLLRGHLTFLSIYV